MPVSITIDKRGANTAAINSVIADTGADVLLRQSKYLNNIVEQDHRAVKRITRPMLVFKAFRSAARMTAGIETMHMIKKGQLHCPEGQRLSAAEQFYSLAFWPSAATSAFARQHAAIATEPATACGALSPLEATLPPKPRLPSFRKLLRQQRHHGSRPQLTNLSLAPPNLCYRLLEGA